MRDFLLQLAVPMAAMKAVTVPSANSFAITPEMVAIGMFALVALIAIYVFLR